MAVEIVDRVGLDLGQTRAIERGLEAIGVAHARVIVAMDLGHEVRELGGQWSTFAADRGGGIVGAKTIVIDDLAHFFLDWRLPGARGAEYLERLLVHEGGHALVTQRGEAPDWTATSELDLTAWQRQLTYCAWMHADEFRAELGAGTLGYSPGPLARQPSFDGNLIDFGTHLMGAFYDPRVRGDAEKFAHKVLIHTNILGKHMAYLAAQHRPTTRKYPLLRESHIEGFLWGLFVGKRWRDHVDWLNSVPASTKSWTPPQRAASLGEGLSFYTDWIQQIGFAFNCSGPRLEVAHLRGSADWEELEARLAQEFEIRDSGA